jgi:hypothetical protein
VGERQAAAEMFAHPVSEVLVDLGPTFTALGVAAFDQQLTEASAAVFVNETPAALEARARAILGVLDAAAGRAPTSTMASTTVAAKVLADQIDRAAKQYMAVKAGAAYEPYLDGFGFYETARSWRTRYGAEIGAVRAEALAAIDEALALLAAAYPGAKRPQSPPGEPGALMAASSRVQLALSGM